MVILLFSTEVALEQAASREDEWKSLSSLFTEYKNKVGQDIDNAKKLNAVYRISLQEYSVLIFMRL